jgi:aryl-alcohol dehydrogenase
MATDLSDLRFHKVQGAVLRPRSALLKIEALEMEGPRDDEVLVRIVSSGICRTDIDWLDHWDGEPVVLGHEGAGVVEEVGNKVKGVTPGDHVVLSYESCGSCSECRKGHPAGCESFWELNFGFARPDGSNAYQSSRVRGHFFGQSSFATHTLVTTRNLVKVPGDVDLHLLAPLGCGLQAGAGTVMNSLRVAKGASVAIFGTGSVGLAAVMAARFLGANPIIGVDMNPGRLELALQLGATHVIDNRGGDIPASLTRITGRGVDYVLEITGDPKMYQIAVDALNQKGMVALVAGPGGGDSLPGGRKVVSVIQGDAVPQLFIPKLISLYRKGQFPFDRLVRFYDFNQISRAIADCRKGATIKPVLRIGEV